MANKTVKLYRNCKTPDGWRKYPAVMAANGKVKPDTVTIKGFEFVFPVGRYEMRSYDGSRTVWTPVDGNATEALAATKTAQKKAAAKAIAGDAGIQVVEEQGRKLVSSELKNWCKATEDRGSMEAAELYERTADGFLSVCKARYVDELSHDDVRAFVTRQRSEGYADRTIANRHAHLKTFFLYLNLDRETIKRLAGAKPRYEKTLPEIFEHDELKPFFASLNTDYDRLLFDVLLTTGLREQEASHLEWTDINWSRSILKVKSKPKWNHTIKDYEERELPLNGNLLADLKAFKDVHHGTLIFGSGGGKRDVPDGHLLRRLKTLVRKAGLNCGKCDTCTGSHECERWFLHKFRATYITTLLRNGLDLRTVMTLSGHSDIESVMRYLRPAEGETVRDKMNSIKWR